MLEALDFCKFLQILTPSNDPYTKMFIYLPFWVVTPKNCDIAKVKNIIWLNESKTCLNIAVEPRFRWSQRIADFVESYVQKCAGLVEISATLCHYRLLGKILTILNCVFFFTSAMFAMNKQSSTFLRSTSRFDLSDQKKVTSDFSRNFFQTSWLHNAVKVGYSDAECTNKNTLLYSIIVIFGIFTVHTIMAS